jgi:hypothetical protein
MMIAPVEIFSELKLFVCTYVAKLGNINIGFEELTHKLCKNLRGNILAINSNYGHASQDGHESFIKYPKNINVEKQSVYMKSRTRKIQGDGTCFNSAIEPVIRLNNSAEDKYYYIKCFPTTGETQIPGVIRDDFSDGHEVLITFIDYLNSFQLGIIEDGIQKQIHIESEGPKMLNYKFRLIRENNRILINLTKIAEYLFLLEQNDEMETWFPVTLPFPIKEIKSPVDDIKVSFRFQTSIKRAPRINIFQEGKINILGSESIESAKLIYNFLTEIFRSNWSKIINIKPERDMVNYISVV